jgi:hypothetical protein
VRAAAGVGSAEQEAWAYTDATAEPEAPTGKAVNTMERICLHLAWFDACTAWEIGNGQAPKGWRAPYACRAVRHGKALPRPDYSTVGPLRQPAMGHRSAM